MICIATIIISFSFKIVMINFTSKHEINITLTTLYIRLNRMLE